MSNIIVSTGIYDLIKDHIRRKKVTPAEEEILKSELKAAKQVRRKDIPADVVDIDSRITIIDHSANSEEVYQFVAPDRAKPKNNTKSILTRMGLALVGYKAGDIVHWPYEDHMKKIEILKVERITA